MKQFSVKTADILTSNTCSEKETSGLETWLSLSILPFVWF